MSLDVNKTAATHRATATAVYYLAQRGYKPIETEVGVYDGWVADIASFVYPTTTELKKLKLLRKEERGGYRVVPVDAKYHEGLNFTDRYGAGPFTAIVEVKTTKADFLKDVGFKFSGKIFPAHFCYVAYPKNLGVSVPHGWIGLLLNDECDRVVKVELESCMDDMHPQWPSDMVDLIAAVAIRRHHLTEYAEKRAFVKLYNAKESQRKKEWRLENAVDAIAACICDGKSLDKGFVSWRIKGKFVRDHIETAVTRIRDFCQKESG